jgi:nucleoside-diphosphate-sugar epimerase
MRVLITGGTGFIGSRLALNCLKRGYSVNIVSQENSGAESENRRFIEAAGGKVAICSVTDRKKIFELVKGIDVVYHLAAAQHEANFSDQRFWDVNVTGTTNVIEASLNARVERFVQGSTIGVYGVSLSGQLDERSALKPDNIYGITKLEAEKIVRSFSEKLEVVVIRISETYGPGDLRLLKMFRGIRKSTFPLIGDGENIHHLIYIADLIHGLHLAATVDKAVGNVFVLSGKDALTTTAMIETIATTLGKASPRLRLPLSPCVLLAILTESLCRPIGIPPPLHRRRMDFFRKSFFFSRELSERILGFVPIVSFQQGVAETVRWYRVMGYM